MLLMDIFNILQFFSRKMVESEHRFPKAFTGKEHHEAGITHKTLDILFNLTAAVFVESFVIKAEIACKHNLVKKKFAESFVCFNYKIFVFETEYFLHYVHHCRRHLI